MRPAVGTGAVCAAPFAPASVQTANPAVASPFPSLSGQEHAGTPAADWRLVTDWSTILGQVFRVPLWMLVDSQFRPADRVQHRYQPERIAHLAALMPQEGQADQLLVRWVDGRFEIIAGHRPRRGAALLRWEAIEVLVVRMGDLQACLTIRLRNLGRIGAPGSEPARLTSDGFRQRGDSEPFIPAMRANIANASQGSVFRQLGMPAPVVALLFETAGLLRHGGALVLAGLVDEHLADLGVKAEAGTRLAEGAPHQSVRARTRQMPSVPAGVLPDVGDNNHFALAEDDLPPVTGTMAWRTSATGYRAVQRASGTGTEGYVCNKTTYATGRPRSAGTTLSADNTFRTDYSGPIMRT